MSIVQGHVYGLKWSQKGLTNMSKVDCYKDMSSLRIKAADGINA
jgi:hypothetical protein